MVGIDIAVAMNGRDQFEITGLRKISHSAKNLVAVFARKSIRNALKLLKQCGALAKQSGKSNISIYHKL